MGYWDTKENVKNSNKEVDEAEKTKLTEQEKKDSERMIKKMESGKGEIAK